MRIKVGICVSKSSTCHESVSSQLLKMVIFFLLLVALQMRLILRFAKQCRKFLRYNLRPHTITVENYLNTTYYILDRRDGKNLPFLPMISPHCNFQVWSFFIYGTLCSWLGPRWWEPRRSKTMSWSGISASLTRKLILFGVLKACTHTSLAFSYLVTSHELRRRETLNANSQTSWVFRKVPDPSWNLTHFVAGVSFMDKVITYTDDQNFHF